MNRVAGAFLVALAPAVLVAWEVFDAPSTRTVSVSIPAAATGSADKPHAADRIPEWVTTVLARPLFSPDRRPPADATANAGGGPASLPRLAGIMIGPAYRSAIFAATGSKLVVVREGDRIAGYRIKSIDSAEVALVGPEGKRFMRPSFDQKQQRPSERPMGSGVPFQAPRSR